MDVSVDVVVLWVGGSEDVCRDAAKIFSRRVIRFAVRAFMRAVGTAQKLVQRLCKVGAAFEDVKGGTVFNR
jgi:hypothetical protein